MITSRSAPRSSAIDATPAAITVGDKQGNTTLFWDTCAERPGAQPTLFPADYSPPVTFSRQCRFERRSDGYALRAGQ